MSSSDGQFFTCNDDSDLHWACYDADAYEVQQIIEDGELDVNLVSLVDGGTPIMRAAEANSASCAELCLAAGAGVNAVDTAGRTALHYAWLHPGNNDCAMRLIEAGGRGCAASAGCQRCRLKHKLLQREQQRLREPVTGVPATRTSPSNVPSPSTAGDFQSSSSIRKKKKSRRRKKDRQSKGSAGDFDFDSRPSGHTTADTMLSPGSIKAFSQKTMQVFAEEFNGSCCSVEALLQAFRMEDARNEGRQAAGCA